MAWFSPRTDVFAYRTGTDLRVQTALGSAVLSGNFAEDFLDGFLSAEGRASERLQPLARLGSDIHRAVIEAARSGGGTAWVPLGTYRQVPTLFLELTGQCNEACSHCYAGSSPAVEASLDEDACLRMIREGATLGFQRLQLTGGDPLLCPFLPKLAAESRAAGWPEIEVYTNGLALTPERLRALAEQRTAFAFSFYSHDAKVHDAITGVPGSQRRTLDAIRAAVASGAKVRASIIAFTDDPPALERTRKTLLRAGVPEGSIWADRVRRVGRGADAPATARAPALPGGAGHASASPSREVRWPGKACVSYSGEVFPCIFSRSVPLGSIHRESLGEILGRARTRRRQALAVGGLSDQLACFDCQLTAIASAESVEAA